MTMASSSIIVPRLWNYCNVLRDERSLPMVGEVGPAVEAGLVRAASEARLRQGENLHVN
jgi:hypothetical protein